MMRIVPRFPRRNLQLQDIAREGGGHRVQAAVDGVPLWFESPDVELRAEADVFVVALLFPAMRWGRRLRTELPIDAKLLSGLRSLLPIYAQWWGYPSDFVDSLSSAGARDVLPSPRVGLCFSGGVDSFYSLLTCDDPVDRLVFVHGFDIPLADRTRWRQAERDFRGVCAELGVPGVVVRTNLREHPVFRKVSWEHAHGAALAAVGHALGEQIGTLRIPPSYRADRLRPWGSDPRTDPLYSSARLRIVHPSSMEGRIERLARIAAHPLVQRRLRVCYENLRPMGNCSICEKCLSTMAALAGLGQLQYYRVFDLSVPLLRRLDAEPRIPEHLLHRWRDIAKLPLEPALARAVERLLRRSANRPQVHSLLPGWWRKAA